MMRRRQGSPFLNISIELGYRLLGGGYLNSLQEVLRKIAPEWSSNVYLWRYREAKTPIDLTSSDALKDLFARRAKEHGPYYFQLVKRFGAPPDPSRLLASLELRSADPALIVVIRIDDNILNRVGNKWIWGNTLFIQVMRKKLEGLSSNDWAILAMEKLCQSLSPVYAHAETPPEYEAQNISHEGGGTQAIGVDYAKALPGIYWLNFLGKPYRDLIELNRLKTAPAHRLREVDEGVMFALSENPGDWPAPEYQSLRRRILEHLGPAHFFSRDEPNRTTIAPDFGLRPS